MMTENDCLHEARRRAFGAIPETCGTVETICEEMAGCDLDHDEVASDLRSIHSELECQLSELDGKIAEVEGAVSGYGRGSADDAIKEQVTYPFRDALIEAHQKAIVAEDSLADTREMLEVEVKRGRNARFAIRCHLAWHRMKQ